MGSGGWVGPISLGAARRELRRGVEARRREGGVSLEARVHRADEERVGGARVQAEVVEQREEGDRLALEQAADGVGLVRGGALRRVESGFGVGSWVGPAAPPPEDRPIVDDDDPGEG